MSKTIVKETVGKLAAAKTAFTKHKKLTTLNYLNI